MKTHWLLTWGLIPLLVSCTSIMTIQLPEFEDQITFHDGTDQYFDNGSLKRCRLSDTVLIQGYSCTNWLHLNENGYLRQCKTTAEIPRSGFIIPAGSVLFFYDELPLKEHFVNFSGPVIINGIACKGGGKISTAFYESGSLSCCFPEQDIVIQGFPCKSSLTKPVYFYPDGPIQSLTLSEDIQRDGATFRKGETIEISETGKISKVI